jgi:NTP pyrophosphatase (non-canonical NTP hydrolase)
VWVLGGIFLVTQLVTSVISNNASAVVFAPIAIEAAELMEHFQWLTPEEASHVMNDPKKAHDVGEEVADCLAYLLGIATKLEIDLSTTLRAKMIRNAEKYPKP